MHVNSTEILQILSFLNQSGVHLTHSQRMLLLQYIPEIAVKNRAPVEEFLASPDVHRIISSASDPVQKGEKIFQLIRKRRYPVSGGKSETLTHHCHSNSSTSVRQLNSKIKLINPYYYGEGIFDLKEHVISLIRSCPLDCAYCFLREVYDTPRFKIGPNYQQIAKELEELRAGEAINNTIYLNAGENADSLISDLEFDLCSKLWDIVQPCKNVFLEFRTKTDKIQKLKKIRNHENRIVMAFSLNPEPDRQVFESTTATIYQRLSAISELVKEGWTIGLRFEPILYTPAYPEKYKKLFNDIFQKVPPQSIHSIAFGCLRLTKGLAKILRQSHPEVLAEEWVLGIDKKWRYPRMIRTEIYRNFLQMIKDYFPHQERIVLSTEYLEVWEQTGISLKTMPDISKIYASRNKN